LTISGTTPKVKPENIFKNVRSTKNLYLHIFQTFVAPTYGLTQVAGRKSAIVNALKQLLVTLLDNQLRGKNTFCNLFAYIKVEIRFIYELQ